MFGSQVISRAVAQHNSGGSRRGSPCSVVPARRFFSIMRLRANLLLQSGSPGRYQEALAEFERVSVHMSDVVIVRSSD